MNAIKNAVMSLNIKYKTPKEIKYTLNEIKLYLNIIDTSSRASIIFVVTQLLEERVFPIIII